MNAAMVTISVNEMQIVLTVLVVTAVNVLQVSNFHPMVLVLVSNFISTIFLLCAYFL